MLISMSPEYLLWYLPCMVAVALVLAATRHERQDLIFRQAYRNAAWITCFMAGIWIAIWFASMWI